MAGVGHVSSTVRKKKAKTIHPQLVFSFLTVQAPTQGMVLSSFRVELSTPINLMKIILQRRA